MKRIIKISCIFLLYLLQILTGKINVSAQSFTVDTILYNGNPNKFINIVFMGDGYQSGQLSAYITDVRNTTNYLFNISPFSEYKNYFNVFAIRVPSTDAGADHPRTAPDCPSAASHPVLSVNTYFNSTFDYFSIHRLLVATNFSAINSVVINNFPLYDQKLMLVNSPYYGGSGGSTATASPNASSIEIMVHELGHSFAGLADEYYAGDAYAAEKPNMTQQTNPALVKWKNWIGYGGVGIYQHCCGGNSALWYRPHNGCKMRYLGTSYPFCPVCKETIVEKIHQLFGTPIIFSQPNQTTISYCTQPLQFLVSLVKPIPNTLRVKWKLNGNDIAMNIDSITITSGQLNIGSNALSVQVLDTTSLTRDSLHTINHIYTVNWTINYNPLSPPSITPSGATTFCRGGNVTLTASSATSYLWSNSATTQSITVSTAGNYSVTVTDGNGCSATSTPTTVTVNSADTSITVNGFTLTSNATPATYQWITCPIMQIINGATNQTYSPSQNGIYAVIVTQNNCTDTSGCYPITVTGLPYINNSTVIVVYPNPTNDILTIKCTGLEDNKYKIILTNALGQLLNEREFNIKSNSLEMQFDIKNFSSGMYFLTVNSKTINRIFKVVVVK